jgi:hypothetical protein
VNVDDTDEALADAFDAPSGERRAVARMACDLAATGRYGEVTDHDLTAEVVVANLRDAPDEELASKWNWWLGALEIAFGRRDAEGGGGFAEFQVRRYEDDAAVGEGGSDGDAGEDESAHGDR